MKLTEIVNKRFSRFWVYKFYLFI